MDPNNLTAVWDHLWGYLKKGGTAPVLLGEFGSRLATTSDQHWFNSIVSYVGVGGFAWTFWSWNPNSGDTGGILNDDWLTVNQAKQSKLATIQFPLSGTVGGRRDHHHEPDPDNGAADHGATDHRAAVRQVTYHVVSQSQDGFTAEVTFRNSGGAAINGWSLAWAFPSSYQLGERLRQLGLHPGRPARPRCSSSPPTCPPRSWRLLGIHMAVAVAWQRACSGDWAAYAAQVSRRSDGDASERSP